MFQVFVHFEFFSLFRLTLCERNSCLLFCCCLFSLVCFLFLRHLLPSFFPFSSFSLPFLFLFSSLSLPSLSLSSFLFSFLSSFNFFWRQFIISIITSRTHAGSCTEFHLICSAAATCFYGCLTPVFISSVFLQNSFSMVENLFFALWIKPF